MPRRAADRAPVLWTTFNRVQANVIIGGIKWPKQAGKRTTTRAVNGIDQDVKLWVMAETLRNQQLA